MCDGHCFLAGPDFVSHWVYEGMAMPCRYSLGFEYLERMCVRLALLWQRVGPLYLLIVYFAPWVLVGALCHVLVL